MANSYNAYTGDGVTKRYTYTFDMLNTSELLVTVNGYDYSPYTIDTVTKSVVFSMAPPQGSAILIARRTASEVFYKFGSDAAFTGKHLDANFEQILYSAQEATEGYEYSSRRYLRVPDAEGEISVLPGVTNRANKYLGFDAAGNPVALAANDGDVPDLAQEVAQLQAAERNTYSLMLSHYGVTLVAGSFEDGALLQGPQEAILWEAGGMPYTWAGEFPKLVTPGSTPDSSGGASPTAWVPVRKQAAASEYSPEMFGAVGDGVTDDSGPLQAAVDAALANGRLKVEGGGVYAVSKPITIDNMGRGFQLELHGLVATADFPATTDWKTANGMLEVGGKANGSAVGLSLRVGYAYGRDRATLFKLLGFGAGGSLFHAGRVQNCVGVYDCTNSTKANSNSNFVEGLYWLNGTYGIRCRRSGAFVTEGTKIRVGFMTGLRYGGIQLFNGAQYFSISSTGIDFCGRNLTQLTLNAMPPATVRETLLTNTATGSTFEVLDLYEAPRGTYNVLVIEPSSSEGGSSRFATGQSVSVGGASYTILGVTTSETKRAYFDFIHGFHGASFGRGYAQFDYLSRAVGGNFNGTVIFWFNSFQEVTHSLNNVWLRQQGSRVSIVDRWSGTRVLSVATTGDMAATFPGGIVTQGTSTLGGAMYTGGYRVYGSEYSTTLAQGTTTNLRTFQYAGNGTVTTTQEMWDVYVAGPNGLSGVGGMCQVSVSPDGIQLFNATGVHGVSLSVSGFTLRAVQGSQPNMIVTATFRRVL